MNELTRIEIANLVADAFGAKGADRSDLLAVAVQRNAPPSMLDKLRELPDRHFRSMQDLWYHIPEVPVG
jgi:hypothetical protein